MSTNVTRLSRQEARSRTYPTLGSAALAPVADDPVERDAPAEPRGPRLRVAPPLPVAVPRAPFVVLVLLVVIGGVLGILLLNTKINENAFILDDLRTRQTALNERQQQLEQEIAEAKSPNQLAADARRLGLVQLEEDQLPQLRVPSGELYGSPEPADGEPSRTSQED